MKRSQRLKRARVTSDGVGVVSHAGAGLLRELAESTGLVECWEEALAGSYRGPWLHSPGQVLVDVAVSIADGARSISDLAVGVGSRLCHSLADLQGGHGLHTGRPTEHRIPGRLRYATL